MRITFQNTDMNQVMEKQEVSRREPASQKAGTDQGFGYMLDISGSSAENQIYQEQGKTVEDVMAQAASQNVDLTGDYMAVMSNSMSEEDFAKLQENGYEVGSTRVDEAVTIVDNIKASLLEAGVSISGYTDTLDMDTLTEITGDAALARDLADAFTEKGVPLTEENARKAMEALEEARTLQTPGNDTLKYMVVHEKEPVIEELYKARYSSTEGNGRQGRGYYQDENGYLTKRADNINWESLQSQIDQIIEKASLSGSEGAQEGARWLISAGIPLTVETLTSYMGLKQIALPMEDKALLSAMATAVSDGKSPGRADLTGADTLWNKAYQIWDTVQKLSAQAADLAASEGKDMTIASLDAAQKLIENGYQNVTQENAAARRQLEEARLQMSILANRELLKSGFAIETAKIEEVIEALRDVEQNGQRILFGGDTQEETFARAQLYAETRQTAEKIPHMPLAVLGKVSIARADFTLTHFRESGEALAASYKKANENYETFQTTPRSDMGDSMAKAFRNTEVLLEELGLEATDANKRAVRILGYNSLEITEENIMTVKAADEALRNVVKKLTPAATMEMIREDKNPLTMTVEELDDYLNERQQDPAREQEKFSKYLYKLEQKKEITKEEKESYIGIYRLLRQVEKSDGAVIGSLLHQGASLSFKNLLTFVRTGKAKGMDAVVDDDMGTLREVKEKGETIDRQIESAFSRHTQEDSYYIRLGHEAYGELDGDKVAQIAPEDTMELEEFTQRLRETQELEESNASYLKEQTKMIRQIRAHGDTSQMLRFLKEPATPENIQAMNEYLSDSAGAFKKIRKDAGRDGNAQDSRFADSISKLEEKFLSREEAGRAYREFTETEKELLEESMYESDEITYPDMRQLGLLYKQVSFTAGLADTERYDIPVITEDSVLALHVQIVHAKEEQGTAEISMETEQYGKISVKLQLTGKRVRGFVLGSQEGCSHKLEAVRERAQEELSRAGFDSDDMHVGIRRDLHIGFTAGKEEATEDGQVSTKELYSAAKAVVIAVRREIERG